ncbi:MAG: SseB family protein [Gammaproteobacteria bacterium]|nr:SseB family protein [Gammaproteobacteria bacterium]MDE2461730.1 SseB family protein [Gammaproteobacteria bacterium]
MTETATRPPGNLESALLTAEDTLESKRKILQLLFDSRVYVVLDQPWDGRSLPSTDMRLLFVSDGKNNEQAMLALFTSREKCAAIPKGDSLFDHPIEVDVRWALLGVPKEAGILINPNSAPGFRVTPPLAAELRTLAERYLAQRLPGAANNPAPAAKP